MAINLKLDNANKAAYLIKEFPDKSVEDILDMWTIPPVQSNAAFWLAQELGWLGEVKDGKIPFVQAPETWQFGEVTSNLEDQIDYCFNRLAKDETDLEEKWLTDWLTGYPAYEILIAMHHLLETKVLAEYEITDHNSQLGDSTYKFYTRFENLKQQWGRKQFKIAPEEDSADDIPEEDKHLEK